jgi:hypothetical protein
MILGALTLVPVVLLVVLARRDMLERPVTTLLAGLIGLLGGAGILVGAVYQPTTANIHSGYSMAGPLEWLLLSAGGGLVGAGAGAAVGWRLPSWRRGVALVVAVALAGVAGWVVSSLRTTIDCDERERYCERRYG